ncbi:MAG: GNAT family N-acetyltransferase [Desulforhabdus sp.]|jgi:ribosomal protein S18 acetylase RimI-like enzyme|nr:GNAT family N-acetyltransferase [Desulforhabdus sp.]
MLKSALQDIQKIGYTTFVKKLFFFKWQIFYLAIDISRFKQMKNSVAVEIQPIDRSFIPEVIDFIKPLGHYGSHPELILDEYMEGTCKGYAAIENGKTIGFVWFADKLASPNFSSPIMRFTWEYFLTCDSDVFLFDIYIDPNHRKHNKGFNLATRFLNELAKFGYKNGAAFVFQNNTASMKMNERLGFSLVGSIIIKRFLAFVALRGSRFSFELSNRNFWSDLIDEMNI